jgi:hypothetical protein
MSLNAAPHDLLRRLLASNGRDEAAARWVSDGLSAWLHAGGSLPLTRCLGLPTTPGKTQQLLRDAWIREAARYVEAATEWQRACKLAEEIRRFERLWECWRNGKLPPPRATPTQACLFFARQHGELPKSSRQVRNVFSR